MGFDWIGSTGEIVAFAQSSLVGGPCVDEHSGDAWELVVAGRPRPQLPHIVRHELGPSVVAVTQGASGHCSRLFERNLIDADEDEPIENVRAFVLCLVG